MASLSQAAAYLPPDNALGPSLGAVLAHYAKRHPPCSTQIVQRMPVDLGDLMWSQPVQPVTPDDATLYHNLTRECMVNPAIIWLEDDIFVVTTKILQRAFIMDDGRKWVKVEPLPAEHPAAGPDRRCSAFSFSGSWHNQLWHNSPDYLAVALIRLDLQTGKPVQLLARRVYKETWKLPAGFVFDARLFRSENGSIMIQQFLTNVPTMAKQMRIISVEIKRIDDQHVPSSSRRYSIDLGAFRPYIYKDTKFEDKNWAGSDASHADRLRALRLVPWHGTSMMSYTHYPNFQPHTVLDFGSWEANGGARNVTAPTFSVPIPIVTSISRLFEAEGVSFRGGTPAVPFPGADGASPEFLAVGHLVAHAECFHHFSADPAEAADNDDGKVVAQEGRDRGRGAPRCPSGYLSMRANSGCSKTGKANFRSPLSAYVPLHHAEDYFMFFYTFSARAPHVVTRLSHAVIPLHKDQPHGGVYFPIGLDALGPLAPVTPSAAAAGADSSSGGGGGGSGAMGADKYILSYGVNDDTGFVLMLTRQEIERLLMPVGEVKPETYEFCSLYNNTSEKETTGAAVN
ncbi:hypothetical protein PLESTM_000336400 [Pleodorina starrii]|nr:hypothetical protein PLESTM_000336400 [Pleodorina starrii]